MHRDWKINLIKTNNPMMVDLSLGWYEFIDKQIAVKDFRFVDEVLKHPPEWNGQEFRMTNQ
jgi:hypothetical protein